MLAVIGTWPDQTPGRQTCPYTFPNERALLGRRELRPFILQSQPLAPVPRECLPMLR